MSIQFVCSIRKPVAQNRQFSFFERRKFTTLDMIQSRIVLPGFRDFHSQRVISRIFHSPHFIFLLFFVSFQIIGIKQYLVRPLGIQFVKNSATSPNTSATSSESGSIASTSAYVEPLIPEAILQSAGRSLGDVINDVSSNFFLSLTVDFNVTHPRRAYRQGSSTDVDETTKCNLQRTYI